MISFRYHLTTLLAVFLALAVGVVLGGGPLSELGRDGDEQPVTRSADLKDARAQIESAEKALGQAAPALYGDKLSGQQVAVLRFPGVSDATLSAVQQQITAAKGASVVYQVSEDLVGASQKSLVDTLGSQLLDQVPDGLVTADAPTYQRMGELIGAGIATTAATKDQGTAQTAGALEGIEAAKLLSGPAKPAARSPLVLVLTADPALAGGLDVLHEGLVTGLSVQSHGVVVAGDTASGLTKDLTAKKLTAQMAVVDGVDQVTGRTATILALVRSITTPGGSFGATGSDGVLPLG